MLSPQLRAHRGPPTKNMTQNPDHQHLAWRQPLKPVNFHGCLTILCAPICTLWSLTGSVVPRLPATTRDKALRFRIARSRCGNHYPAPGFGSFRIRHPLTDESNQCNQGGGLDAVGMFFLRIFFNRSPDRRHPTWSNISLFTPASRVLVGQLEVRRHSYRELLEAEIFALSTVPTPYNWITFLMQMILRRTSMLSRLGCNLIVTGSPAKSNMIIPTLTHTPMC